MIKQAQFRIRLPWACTMHKVQGLIISQAVFFFELEKQKMFKAGQMCVVSSRIKSLEGLCLTDSFQRDAIKANVKSTNEYEQYQQYQQYHRELKFTLLNTRYLRKHDIDITSDSCLTEIDVLFLTETPD